MKLIKKVAQQNLRAFSTEVKSFTDLHKMVNYVDEHQPTRPGQLHQRQLREVRPLPMELGVNGELGLARQR